MGYWEQDSEGRSFSRDADAPEDLAPERQLIWGDGPADIVDDAIWKIKLVFLMDMGRLPSVAEVVAGIKFSTPALGEDLPARPEDATHLTEEQAKVIREYGWAAMGDGRVTPEQQDAIKKIRTVLEELGAD